MSKSTRTGKKSQLQQTSIAFGGESSKMVSAPSPLTLEMLITELEKSRKSMTRELTASLNAALAPIHSSLESTTTTTTTTVAKHTSTISEMETALLTHLDNITSLEQEEVELRTKLASITEEHGTHTRVIGLPEDIEGNNLRQFMADLFKEVAGGAIKLPP